MRVLFDLNVILDVLENRPEFVRDSVTALGRVVSTPRSTAYIATHAVTTAFYILRRHLGLESARVAVKKLFEVLTVLPTPDAVLRSAVDCDCPDYEDAVSFLAAHRAKCDYIVTRNVSDFALSSVPALSPADFLLATSPK